VYLTDFGLTKRATSNTALTMTGQILGTIDYVAPEQVQGDPVDARADIYALAAVTFEMLTGRIPFAGPGPTAKLWAHLNDDPPSAHALRPDLPPAVDAVLARGMAKAPADRYQTAGRFARALKEAIAPSRSVVAPAPAPAPAAPAPAPLAPAPAHAPAAGPGAPAEPGAAEPAPPPRTARPRGDRVRGGARALHARRASRPRGRLLLLAAAVLAVGLAAVAAATFLGGDRGEDATGPAVRLAATPTALATGGGRIVAVDGPGRTVNVIVAQGAAGPLAPARARPDGRRRDRRAHLGHRPARGEP
jgi:serine/threonine-protein kinase